LRQMLGSNLATGLTLVHELTVSAVGYRPKR
jgi:hypothetical protein